MIPQSAPKWKVAQRIFLSMSGDVMFRYHEEPRMKLCDPDDEIFPIPLKYLDVMKQIHGNIDNDAKRDRRLGKRRRPSASSSPQQEESTRWKPMTEITSR